VIPVTLVKILLKPGRALEALAVNSFDLSSQHGPLGVGMRAEFLSRQNAILIKPHVARLHRRMLLRLGNPNDVQVAALGIVELRIVKVRIRLEPGARFQEATNVRVLEQAAVLAKDNSAHQL